MNASTIIKLIIGLVATAVWGAALVGKHFWPDLDTSAIVLACGSALTGLGIYHVASPDGSADKPADKAQGGFISSRMFAAVASVALGLSLLAGCTTTTGSMYRGLATEAKAGIQVFDDNTLSTMHDLICAQPYSAIQRHPEVQPGIVALCGPLVNTASLDPGQVMQMLNIAKQLGLAPVATVPAASAASGAK